MDALLEDYEQPVSTCFLTKTIYVVDCSLGDENAKHQRQYICPGFNIVLQLNSNNILLKVIL
jgi:hypothetical protein